MHLRRVEVRAVDDLIQGEMRVPVSTMVVGSELVRARHVTQGPVFDIGIVNCYPNGAGSQRTDWLVVTVLMPGCLPATYRLLTEQMGSPKDDVGADQSFNYVEDLRVTD